MKEPLNSPILSESYKKTFPNQYGHHNDRCTERGTLQK